MKNDEIKRKNNIKRKNKHVYDKKTANNKKTTNILIRVFIIFFIILFLFSSYKLFEYYKENKANKKISQDILSSAVQIISIDDKKEKIEIDFGKKKKKNEETIGYLKVNGTNVEYPIVQTNNNEFYMIHNFEKTYNSAGWAFADFRNKLDGTDKNIVIYAHNRKDGSMFSTLKNILNKNWEEKEENRDVIFILDNDETNVIYKVFSVYEILEEDYYITTDFSNTDFGKFLEKIKSRSIYDFNVEVDENDNILTLSTCGKNNNYRIVLHAKKVYVR